MTGSERAETAEPPFYEAARPDPQRPVLVAGLSGSAILNGAGEFSLSRETRGAAIDWGGVYGQGVRLTGPWRTTLRIGPRSFELGRGSFVSIRHDPWGARTAHRVEGIEVLDEVIAIPDSPGVGRRLVLSSPKPVGSAMTLEVSFEPFLAPVLLEGIKPHEYRVQRHGGTLSVGSHGYAMSVDAAPTPDELFVDGVPWTGGTRSGELGAIAMRWSIAPRGEATSSIALTVLGGLERSVAVSSGVSEVERAQSWGRRAQGPWSSWLDRIPSVSLPDAPELERAYWFACGALRMLYTAPEPGFEGLVAGYPWYCSLWCRDMAWMLPALLWLGHAEWVESSLETVFRYQAKGHIPVLGAERGELPMQLSPGPIFLYGTSDTTLYYPSILRRFVDHTGSSDLARRLYPALERIVAWGIGKSDPASGLFVNGGEVAEMRQSSDVGSVRIGFDAVDTTIWDSADRRDHAVDVQVLWADALEAVSLLAPEVGSRAAQDLLDRARRVREAVRTSYLWPEEGYLYDALRRDGTPMRKLRPNALRAVSAGLLAPQEARAVVRRAARDDLTTAWGVRTLSSSDPGFDPIAYHDGQVWTIATAWAADAALRAGESDLGVRYLETNARRLLEEGGYANECYRGDRPEPYDSCFLLGFSVAPFVTCLFDSLWGISPHLERSLVEVRPRFPEGWRSAAVGGLTLGKGTLWLEWSPGRLRAGWQGPSALRVSAGGEPVEIAPGQAVSLSLPTGKDTP